VRILVCGGRKYNDRATVHHELYALCPDSVGDTPNDTWLAPRDMVIIHGGADGADLWADEWAILNGLVPLEFKAAWHDLSAVPCKVAHYLGGATYNALAGVNRNQKMIDEGKPDLVLAFPGSTGTEDMVRRAIAAGIEVRRVT
jgi:hypothetical protein